MKIVIIYDSEFGNTEKIALAIRDGIGPGHVVNVVRAAAASHQDTHGADLLFVGSPTHGGRCTEPVRQFIDKLPSTALQGLRAAAFDTAMRAEGQGFVVRRVIKFFGYASTRMVPLLQAKGAGETRTETFAVLGREGPLMDGELVRAGAWARSVVERS
jgi:flavodoxin